MSTKALIVRLLSVKHFYVIAEQMIPWLGLGSFIFGLYGCVSALVGVAPDLQQGEAFRIIYIHVPAAFFSLGIYAIMGVCSAIFLIWRVKICDLVARYSASLGASFTMIALVTGALWGKPMWGTWWVWDPRLTAELILLFLYLGYLALREGILDPRQSAKACAVLAIVGLVDLPIIHFSVEWWATLHQGATFSLTSRPKMATEMLPPLFSMVGSFGLFYLTVLAMRIQTHLWNERHKTPLVIQKWSLNEDGG